MSAPDDRISPSPRSRLGIIHLLGWMAGVAVVLALYRALTDWSEVKSEELDGVRHRHLAFGLAYGCRDWLH
jgi:hypothetical protein